MERFHREYVIDRAAATPLVRIGGVRESVAQHDFSTLRRRIDNPLDVLGLSCREEQEFCFQGYVVVEYEFANVFADWTTARLTGDEDAVAFCLSRFFEDRYARRFARAILTFNGNEKAFEKRRRRVSFRLRRDCDEVSSNR
nr:hypothetical protein [Paraburkholderia tropica]